MQLLEEIPTFMAGHVTLGEGYLLNKSNQYNESSDLRIQHK